MSEHKDNNSHAQKLRQIREERLKLGEEQRRFDEKEKEIEQRQKELVVAFFFD